MNVKIISDLSGELQFDMSAENYIQLLGAATRYAADGDPSETVTTFYADGKPYREERVRIPIDSVLPEMEKQEQEYTGFLLIQCEDCGKIRGFCAKSPISSYICDCGHATKLDALKPALLRCRKCGENFKYKTNIQSERFAYSCLNCGKRNRLFLNSDGDTYITAL